MQTLLNVLNKPLDWVILVGALGTYIWWRSRHLPFIDRLIGPLVSALLAYALSADLAPYFGGSEKAAVIAIMIGGLYVLGGILTVIEDQDFLKDTLQEWVRKRIGLDPKEEDDL